MSFEECARRRIGEIIFCEELARVGSTTGHCGVEFVGIVCGAGMERGYQGIYINGWLAGL